MSLIFWRNLWEIFGQKQCEWIISKEKEADEFALDNMEESLNLYVDSNLWYINTLNCYTILSIRTSDDNSLWEIQKSF